MDKAILLIIDGLGDLPTPKTPLQAAKKPNLDRLAKGGITGMMSPIRRFIVPGSDVSHLNILGYDPTYFYHGRGPLEALGLGMDLREGDVAFRANLATAQGGRIKDRRAGRIDTATASALSKRLSMRIDDIEIAFKNSSEHRGAVVMRGPGLSSNISAIDAHEGEEVPSCSPLDDSAEARKTADIVDRYMKMAGEALSSAPENRGRRLPANILLLRGAGQHSSAPSFFERYGMLSACIAGGALYRGIAKFMGIDILMVPGASGDKGSDLEAKAKAAAKALESYDFVFMHIKMCDSFGHDGDFQGKVKAVEKIDKILPILEKTGACLIITADHSTPVSRKAHSGHEVPILVYGGERGDGVKRFDEISCAEGGLGHLRGKDIIPLILNITGRAQKYGS
ncbi:MAG: 2,3-bisphosphoglycerate-independent phosphoglycerate mutase [Candidatus Micrarchaeota archaeon]